MWLVKTEPSDYAYGDLEKAKTARWDGVKSPAAVRNLAQMKAGDRVFVYHTGDEKAVVGLAEVARESYPDPALKNSKRLVVDLKAVARLARPVTLAEIKSRADFETSPLVRQGRLSVVPLTAAQARVLESLGR
jgi:predicted RNA-binding protein with PUA-like domain